MKSRLIMVTCTAIFMVASLTAQGLSGTFSLTGVTVEYYDIARDSGAAEADKGSTRDLVLSWPSAAAPAFQFPVRHFEPGDTIGTPGVALPTPLHLAAAGINLTVIFNEDGTFEIPDVPVSTYPTISIENCSTFASIPTVAEAGIYEWDGVEPRGQFGILESGVFFLYSADSTAENHGWLTVIRNAKGQISDLILQWDAVDGVESDHGIDANGVLNRQLGVGSLPADTGFVAYLKTLKPDLNVGTHPTLGENFPGDGVDFKANWMYLFDPAGADGQVFTGDEPLQFTGYYFTYNDMVAIGTLAALFKAQFASTNDLAASVTFAVDSTLKFFGCPSAVAAAVSQVIDDSVAVWMARGVSIDDALKNGVFTSIGAAMTVAAGTWTFPNDSGHDYAGDPTQGGRLVFEMGNQCVPERQRQFITGLLRNVDVAVDEEKALLPDKFALHQNYPNPFNPNTTISFDLPLGGDVSVTVWNLLGEKVRTLHSGQMNPGRHTVVFDGRNGSGAPLATGIYLYRLDAESYTKTRKMLLMK